MKTEFVKKWLKWPIRLFLLVLVYIFIANWMANHQERLNEAVLYGSFQDFDHQEYEQFNKAKKFYPYVKYLPWISVADPQGIAVERWKPRWANEFCQDFRNLLTKTELFKEAYSRTETVYAIIRLAFNYATAGYEFDSIRFSEIIKLVNLETQTTLDNSNILLVTRDSLVFFDERWNDTILITGEARSECLNVLNQLESPPWQHLDSHVHELDLFNYDELFLDNELESFVLEHKMAFETFGYYGPARLFENAGKRLGIHPDGWFPE